MLIIIIIIIIIRRRRRRRKKKISSSNGYYRSMKAKRQILVTCQRAEKDVEHESVGNTSWIWRTRNDQFTQSNTQKRAEKDVEHESVGNTSWIWRTRNDQFTQSNTQKRAEKMGNMKVSVIPVEFGALGMINSLSNTQKITKLENASLWSHTWILV